MTPPGSGDPAGPFWLPGGWGHESQSRPLSGPWGFLPSLCDTGSHKARSFLAAQDGLQVVLVCPPAAGSARFLILHRDPFPQESLLRGGPEAGEKEGSGDHMVPAGQL